MQKLLRTSAALAVILVACFTLTGAQESELDGAEWNDDTSSITVKGKAEDIALSELIRWYSESTGRNLMFDPKRIYANVTIVAPTDGAELDPEALLLSALADFRLTIVNDGVFDKIIPAAEACTMAESVTVDELADLSPVRYARIVVSLRNSEANAVRGAIQNLTTRQGGIVNPIAGANALIICDYVKNLQMIVEMIQQMESEAETETRVVRLQHVSFEDIQGALDASILRSKGGMGERLQASIGYTKDMKTVSITGNVRDVERVAGVVAELDKPEED